jgi:hypothetical protein
MSRCHESVDHSTFDLPLEAAHTRIAELRAAARSARSHAQGSGPWTRLRAAVGRGLIALGSALLVEDRRSHQRPAA